MTRSDRLAAIGAVTIAALILAHATFAALEQRNAPPKTWEPATENWQGWEIVCSTDAECLADNPGRFDYQLSN